MRDTMGELWIWHSSQPLSSTTFVRVLQHSCMHNSKLPIVYERSTYRMTALLSEMYVVCARAGCEIWFSRYGSKHTSQSLSDKPCMHLHVRTDTHNLKTTAYKPGYVRSAYRTIALLLETFEFLVWFRAAWEARLERYGSRHASVVLWYNTVCTCRYCKPVHTLPFGAQLRFATNLTYLMTAYYTSNDGFIRVV